MYYVLDRVSENIDFCRENYEEPQLEAHAQ